MSSTIKILYPISAYFPSQVGGPSNSLYWICEGLQNDTNVKTIVVTSKEGIDLNQIKLDKWYKKGNNEVIYTNSRGMLPLSLMIKSLKKLNGVDVIHLNSLFHPPSLILTILCSLFYKKKIVVSIRGELDKYALETFRPRLKKLFLKIWKLYLGSIVFHCTVKEEKEYAKNIFGRDINTIQLPNYILKPKINLNLIKQYSLNYILYLGRLHEKKGIENLLYALSKSESFKSSKTVLKVAGKGNLDYEKKLKNLVKTLKLKGKVDFLGQIEGDEKERLIAEAFFLIMPSFTENFGNVVVESLVHGTPVIASTGTPWEILETKNAGFWVDNSIDSLINIINKLYTIEEDNYMQLSKNAINLADKEFDIKNNYNKWVDFYTKLLNQ